MSKTPVTFLGLGAMGKAMVTTFLTNGHPTTVWNRTPEKADPLVALGAVRADDVESAVEASELVIACIWDYASVRETLEPVAAALKGRTLVNLTNGTPDQARRMAAWADEHGITYVDGGIMAIPPGIGTEQSFIVYSGAREAFDAYLPVLELLGAARFVGTDPGLAALYDVSLLSGMYGQFMGVMHALAMTSSAGVPAEEFTPLLTAWLEAMATSIPRFAEQIATGDHSQHVVSNLAMQTAGYGNLVTAAEEQGVRPVFLTALQELMVRRTAEGYGADDITSVVELMKK
ncbi:NAD(P)-dependent oxidoreductase [Streptomyces huiliensis]|uniref:NAD(P)-dependent oxidoreductase n=1 Tax=Streptomyces huiliensis TaxID=2876027 RepID=UPI001CC08224|nr:NAD(P)-binding domain-containing protein [Streptomyces huiliensis]MBZ4320687.1 NAD(P)-binding domain-containing protein [Streptomyces huiliensis]